MGFWDFLPWVGDDKPAPAPAPAPAPKPEPKPPKPQSPDSQRNAGQPAWTPPANLPAPPQMKQGTAPPPPKPINSVRDWLHRNDPEYRKPATPLSEEAKAAPPAMSPQLQAALNEANWQLPTNANANKEMKLDFEKGGVKELADYSYRISSEENKRILDQYATPGALYAGYAPPPDVNMNKNMPLMNMQEEESAALTWDQYEALSKDQRAAVDFNTLLIDARESDLGKSQYLSPEAKAEYDAKVEKIFGKGGGSETLAPKTVDLLSKLDMNLVGQDLDEFLSLERAIDTTELADFKFSDADIKTLNTEINGQTPTYSEVRAPENLLNIDAATVQKAQQVIKTALASPEALTYDFNTLMYGPSSQMQLTGQPPLGFGNETTQWSNPQDAEKSGFFQTALGLLSSPDLSGTNLPPGTDPMGWILSQMPQLSGYDDQTQQQFLSYVQSQVDLLGQYGTEEQATTAAMVAKRAGLGG